MRARGLADRGVRAALLAAVLFGAGTPLAKLLLGQVSPWLMAGLLYCGSGLGLGLLRLLRRARPAALEPPAAPLARADRLPLAGAVLCGGVAAPVLLMWGLASMPASGASLLLNAESVFTAVLAWVVFRENVDRRVLLGLVAIVAGAVVLSVPTGAALGGPWPSLAVLGACLAWGLDNNLTRQVALADATWLAAVKGAVAGPVNLALALALGAPWPPAPLVAAALALGFVTYGVSLSLFIVGLRHVGTARAGAYFAVAPFCGAALALVLGEPITWPLVVAGALMGLGVWLHLTERHAHAHVHAPLTHTHAHTHDAHHRHPHPDGAVPEGSGTDGHVHEHTHDPLAHTHEHYPDAHHRHPHGS